MYIDIHSHFPSAEQDTFSLVTWEVADAMKQNLWNLNGNAVSLGIHPWHIDENSLDAQWDFLEKNLSLNKVKALGECGLDKLCNTPWELQQHVFQKQIQWSEKFGKPLIIHCVKAFDELIALYKKYRPRQAWIIHGFRGNPQQMKQLINQGFYLSFGEHFNEETVREIPPERLFLETDEAGISIKQVYQKVAVCREMDEMALISQIENNFMDCFAIARNDGTKNKTDPSLKNKT